MNGADVANQRRKHLTTQRKHNMRNWRPLFHWLLDITLTNCFIQWNLQARRKDPDANWDPVGFNRALRDSLLTYGHLAHASESVLINNVPEAIEAVEASRQRRTVIQREIPAERTRKGLLLGVPRHVEAMACA
jgi:hypothetical protein